jgi:hypothetical protein
MVEGMTPASDASNQTPPEPIDPFASLPADLGAMARDFDTAMRREMRWLSGAMRVVGFGLTAYLVWYIQREGRLWTPRDEEWIPGLIALVAGTAGVWLRRCAETAPLVRGLVARFGTVSQVRLQITYGRNSQRRTSLVFEPLGPGLNILPIGSMAIDDPEALRLLAEAQRLCPLVRQAPTETPSVT